MYSTSSYLSVYQQLIHLNSSNLVICIPENYSSEFQLLYTSEDVIITIIVGEQADDDDDDSGWP